MISAPQQRGGQPRSLLAQRQQAPQPQHRNPWHSGVWLETRACADCVTPITQFNVEDVLPMVVSKENLKRMADRAKGKQESLPLFGERVLRQTVADLKASVRDAVLGPDEPDGGRAGAARP